ncbi:MAG: glycosyltransferase family 2 protein [Alkalispirochaeta sp.]
MMTLHPLPGGASADPHPLEGGSDSPPFRSDLISVIIPVYNRRELLPQALDSVTSQELPPGMQMEVIVVDDGSTDGSDRLAVERSELDPRIRVLPVSHSGYPGAVRNRGAAAARGALLAFLDSDDTWLPGKLVAQHRLHRRAALSHTRERWIRDGRTVSQRSQRHARAGDIFSDALHKCIIGPSTAMIDAALYHRIGGFREDLEVAEDYEFWLRVLCHTAVAYTDTPYTVKYAGPWAQLSGKYGQIEPFRIAALRPLVDSEYFRIHRSDAAQQAAARTLARKMEIYAGGARKRHRLDEAEQLEEAAKKYRILPGF